MNGWILFQLAVDIALLALVIVYILRTGAGARDNEAPPAPEPVDTAELETLMDELARLVVRAEKAAVRLESADKASPRIDEKEPQKAVKFPAGKEGGSAPAENTYEKAARLIRKGLPDDEIGKMVGLPASEISLIRNMI